MLIRKAAALVALLSVSSTIAAYAAKEAKVPRCNGQAKRPANPYGTVLPTLPSRSAGGAAPSTKPTQLFPSSASPGVDEPAGHNSAVPPISAAPPSPIDTGHSQPVYASC